jgi:PAS domain S-box-containing protein
MGSADAQPNDWERFFWTIFERSNNAIALLDERRVNVEVNEAMSQLLGVPRDELVGTAVDAHLAPEECATLEQEWRDLWQAGDWTGERTAVRGDGSRVRVHYAARTGEIADRKLVILVLMEAEPEQMRPRPSPQLGELTPREREILHLVALGRSSPQIAAELVISPETVRTHVRNAMSKLGARTRAQLVAIALTDRLFEPTDRLVEHSE